MAAPPTSPVSSSHDDSEDNPSIGSALVELVDQQALASPLKSGLAELWRKQQLCDVIICARNGQRLPAHKVALAAYFQHFRDVLIEDGKDMKGQTEVSVDADPYLLKLLLGFVYEHKVLVPVSCHKDLVKTATDLGFVALDLLTPPRDVTNWSNNDVTPDNCLKLWSLCRGQNSRSSNGVGPKAFAMALENFERLKYRDSFKALTFDLLCEYLCHGELNIRAPDDRLYAALMWVQAAQGKRDHHVTTILQQIPLTFVTRIIKFARRHPAVRNNKDALQILEQVYDEVDSSPAERTQYVTKGSLVITGFRPFNEVKLDLEEPTQDILAVSVGANSQYQVLGEIGSTIESNANCCICNGKLYACGLGNTRQDVWSFNLKDKTTCKSARLAHPRRRHGMISSGVVVYIVGGAIDGTEVDDVVAFNPTSHHVETSKLPLKRDNFRCCALPGAREFLCVGGKCHGGSLIQRFRGTKALKGYAYTERDLHWICGVIHVDKYVIIIGNQGTAVGKLKYIDSYAMFKLSGRYQVPNYGCAVVLSDCKKYVYLVGGVRDTEAGYPRYHSLYRAAVLDIIHNQGPAQGWVAVHTSPRPLPQGFIYGYAMADKQYV